ncbi:Fis family transcriptional regulator [Vibrio sp. ZSDE26]|uniref:Fis family transcriptional regulator n=1 Tax=Vibrio amylolyticus TaxID=2847292 RepID=A0A9X1XKL4_9VIBR|nr:Fis family transcriptional regulator [Vibrio amylolyticus]MCK6263428.1 Fis family transcriptional regulator [Vibrio amylolyticus]
MRKTDKKIDNQLRATLTEVCDVLLEENNGFQWLTHSVNYSNFPKSLVITCVFDTNEQLGSFLENNNDNPLLMLVENKLNAVNISIKNVADHVRFDTEENCRDEHSGNWAKRLG